MPSVTRSASQKLEDNKKSKRSAEDNGGKSKRGKTPANSTPTITNTNSRRSTRGSSLQKQDNLPSPSPSLRKSERLVNGISNNSPLNKIPESVKKRTMPSPPTKHLKNKKQHCSISASVESCRKRSCSSGSLKSGKIITSSKSNNLEGNEQLRGKKRARSVSEIGEKVEMQSADGGEQARKRRLDDRNNRKFLMAQLTTVRRPDNNRCPEVEVVENDETSHLEVCEDATDGGNTGEDEDLKERHLIPSRGDEEDIELSACLVMGTSNHQNCSEYVYESDEELCPPSEGNIPLPCSSNGLNMKQDVKEAQGVEEIEMTQVVELATRALPDAGPSNISGISSDMIVECSIPETKDAHKLAAGALPDAEPSNISCISSDMIVECSIPETEDASKDVQLPLENVSTGDKECLEQQQTVSMAVPLPSESSNSESPSTNDPVLQTDVPSSSQQDDETVRNTLAGPTMQFSRLEPWGGSQVPLITTTGTPQMFSADPLRSEFEKILRQKELITKIADDEKKRLSTEQAREIEEVNKKYNAFIEAAELRLQQTHNLLDMNYKKVCLNRLLAEAYKYRCGNFVSSTQAAQGMTHSAQRAMPHLQTYIPSGISREAASSSLSATQSPMPTEGRSTSTYPNLEPVANSTLRPLNSFSQHFK